ncbi:sensor histidine kinase [Pedobacter metabolipauper]|uniref:histidine kinase n=1 Tax=Pedobacter metabolipauper TaxID=425513 RepID=A0A4R6T0H7_9SPHI|nr:HAMP domain-containing sensor histidine kinase [Pedobacter metabolipauper]TDQ11865.1 phospho-acceptor domain-containing protein [Pedobacter metabolipauper]
MKRHITLILILMSVCVTGIAGLQLYWNFQNYKSTVKSFDRGINEALNHALNREMDERHQQLIKKFKGWLSDTSFVQITCNLDNRKLSTIFHINDTHPYVKGQKGATFGLTDYKEKLTKVTPKAKKLLIDHFGDVILKKDLHDGNIYYYTARLGDSLETAYEASNLNIKVLSRFYTEELSAKGIHSGFILNPKNPDQQSYLTQKVNAALRRPYRKEMISAGFESPDYFFLKEMKWLIISSLLLISITIFCFAYTVKTLLSQHKLAELKDDFINNITHEINTPLSSIRITAESLKTFDHDRNTQKGYLDIISYQAEKLSGLTTQILTLNRFKKNVKKDLPEIELNDVLRKAIKEMEPQSLHHKAVIKFQPSQKPVCVRAEIESLIHVFTNIIDNALKYNHGTAHLDITLTAVGSNAEITFSDNGIGIPPEYLPMVFDRFFRIPKGNIHDIKGYGLGLSFVKQMIEYYKGSVSVAANQINGAVFIIRLPIC